MPLLQPQGCYFQLKERGTAAQEVGQVDITSALKAWMAKWRPPVWRVMVSSAVRPSAAGAWRVNAEGVERFAPRSEKSMADGRKIEV